MPLRRVILWLIHVRQIIRLNLKMERCLPIKTLRLVIKKLAIDTV